MGGGCSTGYWGDLGGFGVNLICSGGFRVNKRGVLGSIYWDWGGFGVNLKCPGGFRGRYEGVRVFGVNLEGFRGQPDWL